MAKGPSRLNLLSHAGSRIIKNMAAFEKKKEKKNYLGETESNSRRNLSAPIWLNRSRSEFAPSHLFPACFGPKAALCLVRHPQCSKMPPLRGMGLVPTAAAAAD